MRLPVRAMHQDRTAAGTANPKSLASPGLLAHITVSKYQDTLPLYRQETILQRIGVDMPRATLANWMIRAGTLVQPLINLLRDRLLAHDIIQMDETTVQVLQEDGKAAPSTSYLWLQRGGRRTNGWCSMTTIPAEARRCPNGCWRASKGICKLMAKTRTTRPSR